MTFVDDPISSDQWRFIKKRYRTTEFQSQIFLLHRVMDI